MYVTELAQINKYTRNIQNKIIEEMLYHSILKVKQGYTKINTHGDFPIRIGKMEFLLGIIQYDLI